MNKNDIPVIIGDVHSSIFLLTPLLNKLGFFYKKGKGWIRESNYFIIFLGDLNDYRSSYRQQEASAIQTIMVAKELMNKGWSITLNSNHQDKLVRFFGPPNLYGKKVDISPGFDLTLNEIQKIDISEKIDILLWLKKLPYYYCFTYNDIDYVCAHAYWQDWMNNPKQNLKQIKQQCIYGPPKIKDESGNKVIVKDWWHSFKPQSKKVIVGHNHVEYYSDNIIVLDGNAGSGGTLLAYNLYDNSTLRSN